ncbi:unnamed protein product [Cunninghamella blakesleeana]
MSIPLNLIQYIGHVPFFHHTVKSTSTLCFIPGFRSSFQSSNKSTYLYQWAIKNNINYLTWDHPKETSVQDWYQEGLKIIETQLLLKSKHDKKQNIVLVGASLGTWLALHISDQLLKPTYQQRIKLCGLIGIGGAVDVTEKWLKEEVKEKDIHHGMWRRPSQYAVEGYYDISMSFLETSRSASVLPSSLYGSQHPPLQINYPIHLIHGKNDNDVSMAQVSELMDWLNKSNSCGNTYLHLMEDGDHRMSREQDLWLLDKVLYGTCAQDFLL